MNEELADKLMRSLIIGFCGALFGVTAYTAYHTWQGKRKQKESGDFQTRDFRPNNRSVRRYIDLQIKQFEIEMRKKRSEQKESVDFQTRDFKPNVRRYIDTQYVLFEAEVRKKRDGSISHAYQT